MEKEHKEIRSNGREHKGIKRNRKGPRGDRELEMKRINKRRLLLEFRN
jgi:hypothetical protein